MIHTSLEILQFPRIVKLWNYLEIDSMKLLVVMASEDQVVGHLGSIRFFEAFSLLLTFKHKLSILVLYF